MSIEYKDMKLPQTQQPQKYVGLYVIDFGDKCSVGYRPEEVATLLESERFADAKVYKIHRARPDGTMELQGVSRQRFHLESGMFFHCRDNDSGAADYRQLLRWSQKKLPPCRAKLQLAAQKDEQLLIAIIYPSEYEQEMGHWLAESGFVGSGPVDAGISQVQKYYDSQYEILEKTQLWADDSLAIRDNQQLLAAVGDDFQR